MKTGSYRGDFSGRAPLRADRPVLPSTPENEAIFGRAALAELAELAREGDDSLFAAGVLNLAGRLQAEDRLEAAAELYAVVAGAVPPLTGDKRERPLQARAQRHLDGLHGKGTFEYRAEFLLRRLAKDATHPSSILAMGAAGLAFRLTRAATLSRLAMSPAGFFTRGLGLRAGGALAGFGVETLAFTAVGKGGAVLFGEPVDLSPRAWVRDGAAGALTLGALKGAGALTQAGLRRWAAGQGALAAATRGLAPQAAMFGGILLAHRLEESLGWRPASSNSVRVGDALATSVHFRVGGRLAGALLGRRFKALEAGLDLQAAQASRGDPRILALATGLAPAGGGWLNPGFAAVSNPLESRPMLSQAQSEGGGARSETFLNVKQIETKLSRGNILLDLATREAAMTRGMVHLMYSLEDGFTSLLHGYRTKESSLLQGPLVAMLRQDPGLRKFLLDHGSEPAKHLWALIDVDTGELQRIVAFDRVKRPRSVLLWDPRAAVQGERATRSPVVSLDFGQHRPEFPYVVSRLYSWDAKAKVLSQDIPAPTPRYNDLGVEEAYRPERQAELLAADRLKIRIFPETAQELHFEIGRPASPAWRLSDARGGLLLAMSRTGEGHYFEFSRFAPALTMPARLEPAGEKTGRQATPPAAEPKPPVRQAKAAKPKGPVKPSLEEAGPAAKKEKPAAAVAAPEPQPAQEPSPQLRQALAALAELEKLPGENSKQVRQALTKLRAELRLLSKPELEIAVDAIAGKLETLLWLSEPAESFFRQELPHWPVFLRLRFAVALSAYLADPAPPRRAQSFGMFREIVPRLETWELQELQAALEKKFPRGSLTPDRRMMVDQVRILIRDALGPRGGSLPPATPLALLLGAATLLDPGKAEAATGDFLMSVANASRAVPPLGAALLAGAVTFVLRSRAARRLGNEALALGSAFLSRLSGGKTPIVLAREGAHPYELHLPDLSHWLRKGAEAVIAKREGREMSLKTSWLSARLPAYENLPPGTLRLNFRIEEGDRQGIAVVYLEKDALHLQNLETDRMRPGAGTLLIDWLATQAALRGLRFHLRDTHNPQIFRILNRERIFAPGTAWAEGFFHDPLTAEKIRVAGPVEDPLFAEERQAAAFHITGILNPMRLPFYLRRREGADALALPKGRQ
ncbi:hypothetical protein FBR05_06530 [Deltaproteobacteria bacterium PRO3]|nr:hypothetical protein [Deltaproteobacteria bacterium PRO3]